MQRCVVLLRALTGSAKIMAGALNTKQNMKGEHVSWSVSILTEVNCVVYYGELFFCDPSLLKFKV